MICVFFFFFFCDRLVAAFTEVLAHCKYRNRASDAKLRSYEHFYRQKHLIFNFSCEIDVCSPAEGDGHNAGAVLCYLKEGGLGEIKVLERRIAPAAVVVREGVIRGAEIGGGDDEGAGKAPLRIVGAPHFVASPATEPIVEQRGAEGRSVRPVPLAVEVAISTRPSYKNKNR